MADKHTLNYEVRELKLGSSFTNNKASQYHTIKYDFKPASVDVNKMATVDVGTNNQVTVTVPHLDGSGVPQTVFKGNQRPYAKECVLIIDHVTGEITLEKLSSNIQVKKTRQESATKARPLTPVTSELQNTTQRSSSRTRVATNRRANPPPPPPGGAGVPAGAGAGGARYGAGGGGGGGAGGGAGGKPQHMLRSPPRVRTSPPQAAPWSGGGNSTLASLPMIGLDDALGPAPAAHVPPAAPPVPPAPPRAPERERAPERAPERDRSYVPERDRHFNSLPPAPQPPAAPQQQQQLDSSSSSSSDSDSGSGSDSDSDDDRPAPPAPHAPHAPPAHALHNGSAGNTSLPSDVLNDDLCLSESGSDSD